MLQIWEAKWVFRVSSNINSNSSAKLVAWCLCETWQEACFLVLVFPHLESFLATRRCRGLAELFRLWHCCDAQMCYRQWLLYEVGRSVDHGARCRRLLVHWIFCSFSSRVPSYGPGCCALMRLGYLCRDWCWRSACSHLHGWSARFLSSVVLAAWVVRPVWLVVLLREGLVVGSHALLFLDNCLSPNLVGSVRYNIHAVAP